MTDEERALAKKWVEAWKRAGPELERIRRDEVRESNTATTIQHFTGIVLHSLKQYPPQPTSGLIEQQAWFKKLHKR